MEINIRFWTVLVVAGPMLLVWLIITIRAAIEKSRNEENENG